MKNSGISFHYLRFVAGVTGSTGFLGVNPGPPNTELNGAILTTTNGAEPDLRQDLDLKLLEIKELYTPGILTARPWK